MGYLYRSSMDLSVPKDFKISFTGELNFFLDRKTDINLPKISIFSEDEGIPEQCDLNSNKSSDCDIVIGIDFGTSSTKVALGDRQLNKSYAIPFCDDNGVDRYLLPSCFYVTRGEYSLVSGNDKCDDLKLNILSRPNDQDCQIKVVAYWALIIRHIRSWLYTTHTDSYRDKEIFWTISVGIPIVDRTDTGNLDLYEKLMKCAWRVAGKNKSINRDSVKSVVKKFDINKTKENDPEVKVVPELAAQIYGFVISNSFDEKAKNIYMMFDIGGGSLDSAIFHVKRGRGNRWIFSYFNAQVNPFGVLNLHRYRISFWESCLRQNGVSSKFIKNIARYTLDSGNKVLIPDSFDEYIGGVSVSFNDFKNNPDWIFGKHALEQIKTNTLYKAVISLKMLSKDDVKGLTFYACGGGSNMPFFQKNVIDEVEKPSKNLTWLHARHKLMPRPDNFQVIGLNNKDFDRLSVAYGLSQLELDGEEGLIWPDPIYNVSNNYKVQDSVGVEYVSKDMV